VKLYFSFILLLALGAVVDSHVELRHANMEIKGHEKPLMEVVILRKSRPVALEELLTGAVVPHLHFVWGSSARVFTKNRFPQVSPIHVLGEFKWQALNFAALSVGDAKERVDSGRRRRSISGRNGTLGLFLLAAGWPGRRFTRAEDDAIAAAAVVLFLLPRGRPRPRFSTGAPMFKPDSLASAMEKSTKEEKP
jgi:hypothetical protein